jgi:hypothetical protein
VTPRAGCVTTAATRSVGQVSVRTWDSQSPQSMRSHSFTKGV